MELFVLAALLWAVMPALLYLTGWAVRHYANTAPVRRGAAVARKTPVPTPGGGLAAGAKD